MIDPQKERLEILWYKTGPLDLLYTSEISKAGISETSFAIGNGTTPNQAIAMALRALADWIDPPNAKV